MCLMVVKVYMPSHFADTLHHSLWIELEYVQKTGIIIKIAIGWAYYWLWTPLIHLKPHTSSVEWNPYLYKCCDFQWLRMQVEIWVWYLTLLKVADIFIAVCMPQTGEIILPWHHYIQMVDFFTYPLFYNNTSGNWWCYRKKKRFRNHSVTSSMFRLSLKPTYFQR